MEITEILQVLERTRSSVRATRAMLADREPTPDRLAILADFDREIRAFEEAAAILRQVPDDVPLTLEQLREMDGMPVWVTPAGFFALVIAKRGKRVELICNDGERVYADKEIELVGPVYACPPAHIGREAWVSVEERLPDNEKPVLATPSPPLKAGFCGSAAWGWRFPVQCVPSAEPTAPPPGVSTARAWSMTASSVISN